MSKQILLFSGSSNKTLAKEIGKNINSPLGAIELKIFPDNEISVTISEKVEDKNVFILQSLAIDPHRYLFELLIIVDALKRASAKKITAIIPYYSYGRQDRRINPGEPITAKLIANLLTSAGVTHLITLDLHADPIEGFFDIPVTHLHSQELLVNEAKKILQPNTVVVASDIGSFKMAEQIAKSLHLDLVIIRKERLSPAQVKTALIGNVTNKNVFLVDNICSTGATLISAATLCREKGAKTIIASVTHGIFAGKSLQKIEESPIESLFVTNTICQNDHIMDTKKIRLISVSKIIADAIENTRDP